MTFSMELMYVSCTMNTPSQFLSALSAAGKLCLTLSCTQLFIVLILISGCQKSTHQAISNRSTHNQHIQSNFNEIEKGLEKHKTFRGLFRYGHEIRSFNQCGETDQLWVFDNTDGDIANVYQRLEVPPYQPIFVEFQGNMKPTPLNGFGADYDGAISVEKVTHASNPNESWGCREKYSDFIFKAQGNEPGWTVFIRINDVSFSSINHETPLLFSNTDEMEMGKQVFKSNDHELKVKFTQKKCTDTMSGEIFGWQVKAILDGTSYSGCAKKGDQ